MTKKKPKAHRMAPIDVQKIIAEIGSYERRERDGKLSWQALQEYSGFSQVAMWQKPEIKAAFQRAKRALRADATPQIKPKTVDERIEALQSLVAAKVEQIRAYDELWALYEYNVHRMGWDTEELRRPLPPLARSIVRTRRKIRRRQR